MNSRPAAFGALAPDLPEALRDFHRRYRTLKPPLRPAASVTAAVDAALDAGGIGDETVLLLGVTPEYATLPRRIVAVDWSARMVAAAWPGDTPRRRVVLGDWKRLPLADGSVAAAIGDGVLSMLRFPDEPSRLFDRLRSVVRPGGRILIRCYTTPEPPESPAQVRAAALAGGLAFHAFKQRLNMAVSVEDGQPNIPCARLHERFEQLFPDRGALSEATGWSLRTIAEIDAYRGSRYRHCYPSRAATLGLVPPWARDARFVETQGYPLAEHCPLLLVDLP